MESAGQGNPPDLKIGEPGRPPLADFAHDPVHSAELFVSVVN